MLCGQLKQDARLSAAQPAAEKIVVTLDRSRRRRRTQTPYDPSDAGGSSAAKLHKAEEEEVLIAF